MAERSIVGQTFAGLKVLEELGGGFLKCVCIIDGHIDTYRKLLVMSRDAVCKKCRTTDLQGRRVNNLIVTRDNGNTNVVCRCKVCGHTDSYPRHSLIVKRAECRSCWARYRGMTKRMQI